MTDHLTIPSGEEVAEIHDPFTPGKTLRVARRPLPAWYRGNDTVIEDLRDTYPDYGVREAPRPTTRQRHKVELQEALFESGILPPTVEEAQAIQEMFKEKWERERLDRRRFFDLKAQRKRYATDPEWRNTLLLVQQTRYEVGVNRLGKKVSGAEAKRLQRQRRLEKLIEKGVLKPGDTLNKLRKKNPNHKTRIEP
jgi:hypothetical protein